MGTVSASSAGHWVAILMAQGGNVVLRRFKNSSECIKLRRRMR